MSLNKLEEEKPVQNVTVIHKERNAGAFVDGLLTVLVVVIVFALTASYFVIFDGSVALDFKSLTLNTLWFAFGTISVGILTKKIAKDKGRSSKKYEESEAQANERIKKVNECVGAERVAAYCRQYTDNTVRRRREYYLSGVGLSVEDYEKKYIGKGKKELLGMVKRKELTTEQFKAIRRCDRLKIKAYDPNFILSFSSEIDSNKTPSSMYNTEREDAANTAESIVITLFSSLFVCTLATNILYDFSNEAVIGAVTKIIMSLMTISFKASFGWNIAMKELKRNKLRASEAEACEKWCRENPATTEGEKA